MPALYTGKLKAVSEDEACRERPQCRFHPESRELLEEITFGNLRAHGHSFYVMDICICRRDQIPLRQG
ncbi:hypothetical protein ACSAZL_10780 [Methanosarcina sp. T3]|uniref:hypothetical protein n=1 Tax=Methanosarcina sp. T3 TaxID=3439062 RepID=UPI003F854B0F